MKRLGVLTVAVALTACTSYQHPTHMLLGEASWVQMEVHDVCMKVTNVTDDTVGFIPMDEEIWTQWQLGTRHLDDGTPAIVTEACK